MPLHSYLVLTAFIFLLAVLIIQYLRIKSSPGKFLGTPSAEKLYFYTGKIALFTTWVLFILKAINPQVGYLFLPDSFSWIAVGFLYTGCVIVTFALINLGKSLVVGLPDMETKLQTNGIYRFSRNPLYVGTHIISIGSCIYFPDLINVTFMIYGIYIHHRIVKKEEAFLAERFGNEWLTYVTKVRRYI